MAPSSFIPPDQRLDMELEINPVRVVIHVGAYVLLILVVVRLLRYLLRRGS